MPNDATATTDASAPGAAPTSPARKAGRTASPRRRSRSWRRRSAACARAASPPPTSPAPTSRCRAWPRASARSWRKRAPGAASSFSPASRPSASTRPTAKRCSGASARISAARCRRTRMASCSAASPTRGAPTAAPTPAATRPGRGSTSTPTAATWWACSCQRRAKEGGLSSVVSTMAVHDEIRRTRPDLLPILHRGFHYAEREAADNPEGVSARPIPVFSEHRGVLSCRFIRNPIETGAKRRGVPLTGPEQEALELMSALCAREDMRLDMMLEPGDMQFCNNYTTAHARTEFEDWPEPGAPPADAAPLALLRRAPAARARFRRARRHPGAAARVDDSGRRASLPALASPCSAAAQAACGVRSRRRLRSASSRPSRPGGSRPGDHHRALRIAEPHGGAHRPARRWWTTAPARTASSSTVRRDEGAADG